jgi:hypothetical protein
MLLGVHAICSSASADAGLEVNERGNQIIPAQLVEQLSTALARWDGRGPSDYDTLKAGKALPDGHRSRS